MQGLRTTPFGFYRRQWPKFDQHYIILGNHHLRRVTGDILSSQSKLCRDGKASLESLANVSGNNRTTATLSTRNGDENTLLEKGLRNLSSFLERMLVNGIDPAVELNQYYQKKQVKSIVDCFAAVSTKGNHGANFWHCTFHCPITGKCLSSSLPLPLFIADWDHGRELEIATVELLGKFNCDLDDEGTVYFSTKKAAKKACALAVLVSIDRSRDGTLLATSRVHAMKVLEHLGKGQVPDINEARIAKGTGKNGCSEIQNDSPSMKKKSKFPSWVEGLYGLGV
jgi:hypothetical protein